MTADLPLPSISVITPTHGRSKLVENLLDSLSVARDRFRGSSEVFIIDSSAGAERAAIEAACARHGVRYAAAENNVRQKRNLGIQMAGGSLLLFVDSDCVASPDLLLRHGGAYRDDSVAGVIGLTEFAPWDSIVGRVVARTSFLDAFSYAARFPSAPWGPTCNISYRKAVIDCVGMFDTSMPCRLGGDDVDLGLRVTDAGLTIRCEPRAVVRHTDETWDGPLLISRRAFRWGRMHFYLLQKHERRVYPDFPKPIAIFLLLCMASLAFAFIAGPLALLLPLGWLATELSLEAAVQTISKRKPAELHLELGARFLALLYDAGTVIEALRHGRLAPLVSEISFTPPSSQSRNRRVLQVWSEVLALVVLLILVGVWR
jgi:glycosyltransferase involved in cell wall biosynthesis